MSTPLPPQPHTPIPNPQPKRCPGRTARAFGRAAAVGAACMLAFASLDAVTLTDLLEDPALTPKRFANRFENFDFESHDEVQTPEVFLSSKRGDCDDYAILADHVLRHKGFATRLIHIRLVGRDAHAVCYVTESKAYLDYNNRIYFSNLERSGRTLREIANKVAESFQGNWTSASEFTYEYSEDKKHFVATVVKTEPAANDPDRAAR